MQIQLYVFSENVTVGHSCLHQRQCTGTELASVCNNDRCECQPGYILIGNKCFQGKESLNLISFFRANFYLTPTPNYHVDSD